MLGAEFGVEVRVLDLLVVFTSVFVAGICKAISRDPKHGDLSGIQRTLYTPAKDFLAFTLGRIGTSGQATPCVCPEKPSVLNRSAVSTSTDGTTHEFRSTAGSSWSESCTTGHAPSADKHECCSKVMLDIRRLRLWKTPRRYLGNPSLRKRASHLPSCHWHSFSCSECQGLTPRPGDCSPSEQLV